MPPRITATSQQTRFLKDTEHSSTSTLDLHQLTILLDNKRELLTDAHLHLQEGVHYVLTGRNGTGKSTLLRALAEKLIPGIPRNLRILLMQQTEDEEASEMTSELPVVEYVVRSDKQREQTLREVKELKEALESNDAKAAARVMARLKREMKVKELEEAKKEALLRSGGRGVKARKELTALEKQMEEVRLGERELDEETVARDTEEAIKCLAEREEVLEMISADTAKSRAMELLFGLGFTEETMQKPLRSLSGGWRMRAALAATLFQPSDLLLIDEGTNFLDLPSVLWLQSYLQDLQQTVLFITHDRDFADHVAEQTIILRDHTLEYFNGTPTAYYLVRKEKQQQMSKMKSAQEKQKAHIQSTIQGNINAAHRTGDDKKLKQAVSRQKRLNDRMGLQVSARGGRFKLNRDLPGYHNTSRAEIEIPQDEPPPRIALPTAVPDLRFPGVLVGLENVSFHYRGVPKPTLNNCTLAIHEKARIAITGFNGCGKSTLVSCIVDQTLPGKRTGAITRHPKVRIGHFSQLSVGELTDLGRREPELTALSLILPETESEQSARGLLSSLGLPGRVASDIPIMYLSGGQKVRLALARLLVPVPPQLLVLDEVTTHLDAETVVALARQLRGYEGAIVLVSHDRWFVRVVVEGEAIDGEEELGEEVEAPKQGRVFRIVKGELREMRGGVGEYEEIAERRRKRAKAP